jgi:hypothetical protein
MRTTITRRVVAGIAATVATVATTVVLLAPETADAGNSLSRGNSLRNIAGNSLSGNSL